MSIGKAKLADAARRAHHTDETKYPQGVGVGEESVHGFLAD